MDPCEIASGETSRAGRSTPRRLRPGEVFVPFAKLKDHAANFLTNSAYDPNSKIPEFKVCAVRIERPGTDVKAGRRRRTEAGIPIG